MSDFKNSIYWAELSGSRAAFKLGIDPGEVSSVNIFDEWFFDYYPYLNDEGLVEINKFQGSKVLEIGLGYGSLGRLVAQRCKTYRGVDVSSGPVVFLNKTISSSDALALQASALELPFSDEEFDFVISIGCLHHTGDVETAFQEAFRVLKTGGQMICMVYYAYSYKRWIISPFKTFQKLILESFSRPLRVFSGGGFYDRHIDNSVPPNTEFLSKKQVIEYFPLSAKVSFAVRNVDNLQDLLPVRLQKKTWDKLRIWMVKKGFGQKFGLDLYFTITKFPE